ncbi:MAG: hypothetical protein V7K41_00560 [Nostoc sp.]|uniref:hypothetical protein n=1 Tax=Nostoc sp. TaxID=1180 RepID=UPI002FF839F8
MTLDLDGVDIQNRKFQVIGKRNKQRWCFYSESAAQSLNNYLKYYLMSRVYSIILVNVLPFTPAPKL